MNLLLLDPESLDAEGNAVIRADRYPPRHGLWPPAPGRVLRAGLLNGPAGSAEVLLVEGNRITLRPEFTDPPPAAAPLTLLLALPRPKMLRRVLRSAAELGIKRIHLINSARVEKSYWQSPLLAPRTIERYLVAGLEQCADTVLPEVWLQRRLRPFVEDELPALARDTTRLLAHPAALAPAPGASRAPLTLAIGPEGGFTDFELELFAHAGFGAFSLGPRILRVETALPALVATLLARPPAPPPPAA